MAKRNNAYWQKRMEVLEDEQYRRAEAYYRDVQEQFRKASNSIQMDIERWYQRLADNNGISYASAKRLLKDDELKEFKWTVEQYVKAGKENALDQRWMKELENANEQLRKDMEHITELSRQRRDFFAAASHELKTPITILKGQIESMILGIGKYKDTGKVLPETLKEVENMERLVKEILTISKIEMDGLAGKAELVPLTDTLAKVMETLLPLAQERQITVHSQLAEDVTVSGNASLLEKAIHNILSNGIRHSPEGAEVFIHLTPSVLTVTNTGTSIPEEDLPVLFTPFYRVEKSRNKSTGGSGLGLYLVKTILELHGIPHSIVNTENGVQFTAFLR